MSLRAFFAKQSFGKKEIASLQDCRFAVFAIVGRGHPRNDGLGLVFEALPIFTAYQSLVDLENDGRNART